ncbi:MAG: site-2 protease family protein [Acidobacteriota bacterium]|nr:site-2 protease family protein [Acidobacteriota bacterium]
MRWSVRLGSLFGIPIYLHMTFLLLLGGLGILQLIQGGLAAALFTTTLVVAVFGSVLLHEFGHALTARHYGIGTRDVTLLPIGGLARLDRLPTNPRHELWIALAGPAVNVAIAGVLAIWIALFGGAFFAQLMMINLALAAFNLLPAFPMDGGRVLRALLAQRMGRVPATDIAATIGKGLAIVFGIVGLFFNPMLVFIAIFVWFGAQQEAALTRRMSWVGGSI